MKNKLALCGFLGLFGIVGLLAGSKPLLAFFLFFPLFLLASVPAGERFSAMAFRALRSTFIVNLVLFSGVFLLSGLILRLPGLVALSNFDVMAQMMIAALSWCFVLTIVVFVALVLWGAFRLKKESARDIIL